MSVHGIAGPPGAIAPPLREHDFEYDPRPRHLRVVDNRTAHAQRRRRWIRVGGAAVGVLVVALLFVSVGMHAVLAQNQFRLDRLNAQSAAQQAQYHQLRLQVDRLESPQRIIEAAKGRLGMVQPGSVSYLAPSSATSSAAGATAAPASDRRSSAIPIAVTPPGWSLLKPQLAANP